MSLVARSRLQFLVAWLALDSAARIKAARRILPSVVDRLDQAQAMQQWLQPWLEALLTRRKALAGTLVPAAWHRRLAGLVQDDLLLEPFRLADLRAWPEGYLLRLLVEEVVRLVRLLEAPCAWMQRPGWNDYWDVARWGLAVCLARISQLAEALDRRLTLYPAQTALHWALGMAWQRLTTGQG
jgi:hypothetical protein